MRLPHVVEEMIACLARAPKKDGVDIRLHVPDASAFISSLKLQPILLTLILSAKQAMRRTGLGLCICRDLLTARRIDFD